MKSCQQNALLCVRSHNIEAGFFRRILEHEVAEAVQAVVQQGLMGVGLPLVDVESRFDMESRDSRLPAQAGNCDWFLVGLGEIVKNSLSLSVVCELCGGDLHGAR